MVDFVVDKALNVLENQLDEHAPNRSKASDGSIGDEDHQSRESAHNPQDTEDSMDGNDPDNQVDARDFTHDPAHGADMADFTEQLRVSRDERLYLVIFNHRQFSSYSRDGYPPFTWRPYSGSDQHTGHAHVEVNDYHNDDTRPWKVYMSYKENDQVIDTWSRGIAEIKGPDGKVIRLNQPVLWRQRDEAWQRKTDETLARIEKKLDDLLARPAVVASPVDPATLQPVVEDGVRAVLRDGVGAA